MKLIILLLYVLGYGGAITGGVLMIVLSAKFSFVTAMWEHQHTSESFLRMNGQTVWRLSWGLISGGTVLQMVGSILSVVWF